MKQEMMWWPWQLDHMQIICTLLQIDNHLFFYMPDAIPEAQPRASKHWRQEGCRANVWNNNNTTDANVYGAVTAEQQLKQFTQFRLRTQCNVETKPMELVYESACMLLPSTPTIAIYSYYLAKSWSSF